MNYFDVDDTEGDVSHILEIEPLPRLPNYHIFNKKLDDIIRPRYSFYVKKLDWCEEVRRDPENEELLQVKCTESNCKKWFNPTHQDVKNRLKCLNTINRGESRFYCSDECKNSCSIYGRQKYPKGCKPNTSREVQSELRELVLERDGNECQRCEVTEELECHHIEGILWNPIESADIDMCIILCKECHRLAHSDEECRYVDMQCNENQKGE